MHSALLTECGRVFTWGSGKGGRLGHGDAEDVAIPTEVDVEGRRVLDVACGYDHTLLLIDEE